QQQRRRQHRSLTSTTAQRYHALSSTADRQSSEPASGPPRRQYWGPLHQRPTESHPKFFGFQRYLGGRQRSQDTRYHHWRQLSHFTAFCHLEFILLVAQ